MTLLMSLALAGGVYADDAPPNTGPEFGKASPIGLLVVLLLVVGTFLLIRSMNNRLKRVPESFDPENPAADQAADDGTIQPTGHPAETGEDPVEKPHESG